MAPAKSSGSAAQEPAAWPPIHDPARQEGVDPGSIYGAGRQWTPFGVSALGHEICINIPTGGLQVKVTDLTIPYHGIPLEVVRTLDVQEQFAQTDYLAGHPNTNPRFHFFGNWQLQREAFITPVWSQLTPEVLISDGDTGSSLLYRQYSDFDVNTIPASDVESRLRSYGVPGRTLSALGWKYSIYDCVLRSFQGPFTILTGHVKAETAVDPIDVRLWAFDPVAGTGRTYTSEYAYQDLFDVDGMRETTVQVLVGRVVDALGHAVSFRPSSKAPPYRTYRVVDGLGRAFRFELGNRVTYLDGDHPGGKVKTYFVSTVVDETRPDHNTIEYQYDRDRLSRVIYPAQAGGAPRVVKYDYDDGGNLIRLTDPVGDSFEVEYAEDPLDSDPRLIPRLKVSRISDSEGNSVSYAYDHPNRKVVVTVKSVNQAVHTVTYSYAEDEKDTGQRYITSETIGVTLGQQALQTVRTTWQYSDDGRFLLIATVDPLGGVTASEYNFFNQVTTSVDANSHRRDFAYDVQVAPTPAQPHRYDLIQTSETNIDAHGNKFSVTSSSTWRLYDAVSSGDAADVGESTHRVASQTDELGHTTGFDYDDAKNSFPLKPTKCKDALGQVWHRRYDGAGALLENIDPLGLSRLWVYNAQGMLTRYQDPNGFAFHRVYDLGTGWLTDFTDALGIAPGDPAHSVHYEWNDAQQAVRVKDQVGALTEYAYYRNKRLRSVTRFAPDPRAMVLTYEANGALSVITDPAGHRTFFLYDEAGRLYQTFRDNPKNPTIRFARDPAGRTVSVTDRNSQVTLYQYDALGRLTDIREPPWPVDAPVNPGKVVGITYDHLGRVLTVNDSQFAGRRVQSYNAAGNLTGATDHFGWEQKRFYDARNALIRLQDAAGAIDLRFVRDAAGNLSAISDGDGFDPSRTFRYFRKDGARVDNVYRIEVDKSGIASRFEYDPNRRLTLVEHERAGNRLAAFGYVLRADGRIAKATQDHQGLYDYDGLKQIVGETDAGVLSAYDKAGNRLWRSPNAVPPGKEDVFDSDYRLLNARSKGVVFQYDQNGNRLLSKPHAGGPTAYAFDGANRLMSINNGASSIEYLYDFDSRLMQRVFSQGGNSITERYRHADRGIVGIVDDQDKLRVVYTRDDEGRLLRRRGSEALNPAPAIDAHSLYHLHDGMRSVCRLVAWDGGVRMERDYDAWGAASEKGSVTPPEAFRYRQAYTESGTGLIYFGSRWYDPLIGRWVSQDPFVYALKAAGVDPAAVTDGLANLYRYVGNDPLNSTDSTGFADWIDKIRSWLIGKLFEAAMKAREPDWTKGGQPKGTKTEQVEQKKPPEGEEPQGGDDPHEEQRIAMTPEDQAAVVGTVVAADVAGSLLEIWLLGSELSLVALLAL